MEINDINTLFDSEVVAHSHNKSASKPVGWEIVKVRDVLQKVSKQVEVRENGIYREIGIRSHGKGIFYKESVTSEQLGEKSVFWIEPDCFIVNIVFAWELAVARTTKNEIGFIASHRFPMYKPVANKVDIDFITCLFKSPRGKHLLNLASPGGAGRNKTLGQKEFLELEILVPKNVVEQRKIAEVFSIWDRAIELTEILIKKKEEQKKAIMQQLLTGVKRVMKENTSWETTKIRSILGVRKEKGTITESLPLYSLTIEKGITPKTDRYDREFLVTTEDKKYKITQYKDIVYNPSNLRFGAIAINKVENPVLLSPIYEVLYVKNKKNWNPEFIAHALSWERQIRKFSVMAEGTLVERMSVKVDTFLDMEIFIPANLDEQKRIAEILNLVVQEINTLKKKLELYKMQRVGLEHSMLSGKVRVKV